MTPTFSCSAVRLHSRGSKQPSGLSTCVQWSVRQLMCMDRQDQLRGFDVKWLQSIGWNRGLCFPVLVGWMAGLSVCPY